MKTNYPIQTDLFRFVTIRTPDHINPKHKSSKFIYHPEPFSSVAHDCPSFEDPRSFQKYLDRFNPVTHYEDIRKVKPALYDFISEVLQEGSKNTRIPLSQRTDLEIAPLQRIWLWDQLFFQLITDSSKYIRQAALKLIIGDRMLQESVARYAWSAYQEYRVVIPKFFIECLNKWKYKDCSFELRGVNRLGIADFRKLEQEVCCYVPGEVSHIENVLASEYKERHTRNLVSSEVTTELSVETEIENLSDTTTATRNEIHSEVANVLAQQNSSNYGGSLGVSSSILGAQINANAYADFANSNSSSYSNSSANLYAQEVVRRALERIVQRTTEKRTSRILKEYEENNKHGFDNRNGQEHVTGIYRWLDIIYNNRLVNYGKRLMLEFMVPEPAKFFKRAIKYQPKASEHQGNHGNTESPKSLEELGISTFNDIDRNNYSQLATAYGITLPAPPASTETVSKALSPNPALQHNGTPWTQTFSLTIPANYESHSISGNYSFEYKAWGFAPDAYFTFDVGGIPGGQNGLRSRSKKTINGTVTGTFTTKHSPQLPIVISGRQLYTFGLSIAVTCHLKPSVFSTWQSNAYNQLQAAYKDLLAQSQSNGPGSSNQGAEPEGEDSPFFTSYPEFNRIIEQRELKRACIELITKPFCRKQGVSWLNELKACDNYEIPQINPTKKFDEYTSQVKFLEQAFDWSIMSYLFYPYYWADQCDWAELLQSQDQDLIFQAFKQAGMARIVVPVQPEFNEAVMFYLATGTIWLGGDLVAETNDDLFLSITEEMDHLTPNVEEEWETRVPTNLAIVQKRSAALKEEGLPCCKKVNSNEFTSNIHGDGTILQIIKP